MKTFTEWRTQYFNHYPEAIHFPKLLLLDQYYDYREGVKASGHEPEDAFFPDDPDGLSPEEMYYLPQMVTDEIQAMIQETQQRHLSGGQYEWQLLKVHSKQLLAMMCILTALFYFFFKIINASLANLP